MLTQLFHKHIPLIIMLSQHIITFKSLFQLTINTLTLHILGFTTHSHPNMHPIITLFSKYSTNIKLNTQPFGLHISFQFVPYL